MKSATANWQHAHDVDRDALIVDMNPVCVDVRRFLAALHHKHEEGTCDV